MGDQLEPAEAVGGARRRTLLVLLTATRPRWVVLRPPAGGRRSIDYCLFTIGIPTLAAWRRVG